MRFSKTLNDYFGTTTGGFSEVTKRENQDSQITVVREEKVIIERYFGPENILHKNMSSNPEKAVKEFLLFPQMEKIKLNLVYPKKGRQELRLYLSSNAGFKPDAGNIWFTYVNNEDKIVIGSYTVDEWVKISDISPQSDIFPIDLNEFISIAHAQRTGFGTTEEANKYIKANKTNYRDLGIEIGFGQGRATAIPWIAFLGYGQKVTKGIYPVFLYYKDIKRLILAYGVSEKESPTKNWSSGSKLVSIQTFFEQNGFPPPQKYGKSFVHSVHLIGPKIENKVVRKDLDSVIEVYNQVFANGKATVTSKKFNAKDFYKIAVKAGLNLSEKLIIRFTASILTKPFLILTGLSGSGKTKLAQAFVQWISESKAQYRIIPVGADWTNREPLLGYPDGLRANQYILPDSGALQVMLNAVKPENENKPHFLILDEMNLSHVERYFADFLSIMESHKEMKLYDGSERVSENKQIPQEILWPKNLFIIGTVNVDETTYMFSPKVLDRANVIEFRIEQKEMVQYLNNATELKMEILHTGEDEINPGLGAGMATDFIRIAFSKTIASKADKTLINFFPALQSAGAEFGYRSAFEISRLTGILGKLLEDENLMDGSPFSEHDFMDIAIMQKLLPKLHGSRNRLVPVLVALGRLCIIKFDERYSAEKDKDGKQFISEFFEKEVPDDNILYKLSFDKIRRMYKNLIANGFTSYAEA